LNWRNDTELFEYFITADVPGMKDQLYSVESLVHGRTKKSVRVRDEPDDRGR
jgi:hypothetical protein